MTKTENDILLKLRSLRIDPNPPEEWVYLSVEKKFSTGECEQEDCHQVTSIDKPEGSGQATGSC